MPRLYVVFDSNVYKQLGPAAFDELRAMEKVHSVVGLASYWVGAEFISHLTIGDPESNSCQRSLARLAAHCGQYNGFQTEIRFIADSDSHPCRILFGRTLGSVQQTAAALGALIGEIVSSESADDLVRLRARIEPIRQHVMGEEARFVDDMWKRVILSTVPNAGGWDAIASNETLRNAVLQKLQRDTTDKLFARSLVNRAAAILNTRLDQVTLDAKTGLVLSIFAFPIRFYDQIVRRVIVDGWDLTMHKRSNLLWDWHISFSTSRAGHIEGVPIWLISDDGDLLTAARDSGYRDVVRPLAEYCALLAQPNDEFIVQGPAEI